MERNCLDIKSLEELKDFVREIIKILIFKDLSFAGGYENNYTNLLNFKQHVYDLNVLYLYWQHVAGKFS